MTLALSSNQKRWLPPILSAVVLLTVGVVFRNPLVSWFTGPEDAAMGAPVMGVADASSEHPYSHALGTHDHEEIDHYTCSMHPTVSQHGPGKCPICGMDLVPVTKEQQEQGVVIIDNARRQLIGVRTARVREEAASDIFRAAGRVAYDESALADVNLKVRGWITRLFVSKTGERVGRGQTLFMMYSPELYQAQQDFLLTMRGETAAGSTPPATTFASGEGARSNGSLGQAARQRLHLLGMTDAQVDAVATRGVAEENIAVPSPADGFIIEKNIVEGASVDPGVRLYRIAGMNHVWVEADVYEADLSRVRVGQTVKVRLDYVPERSYEAKVAYLYPYLDDKTRTGKVRIEIVNKQLELRPGMYATVELASEVRTRLRVPAAAIVYTGPRRLVFVDLGEGRFKPQEIQVAGESEGMFEVLSGLSKDDVVATSGVFLIAAEARIRTAGTYWESAPEKSDGADEVSGMNRMPTMTPDVDGMRHESSPDGRASPSMGPPTHAAVKMPRPAPSPATVIAPPKATVFMCPMHPEVRSWAPGKCSKCGMDLQPIGAIP